jgi:RNA polymerase subunit RPABC4/transcription elongation factor Spt4
MVPAGSKFCPNCGQKQEAPQAAFCTGCGQEVPAGSKFCPSCGTKLG